MPSSTEEKIEEIIKDLTLSLIDAQKTDTGNLSAGVRLRKRLAEAILKIKDTRALVLDLKHSKKEGE